MLKIFASIHYGLYTELLLLLRRSQEWLYPLAFFLIVISLFPLAFNPEEQFLKSILPGGIWLAALFANILSIQNLYAAELEDEHIFQLLLTSQSLSELILMKLIAQWFIIQFPIILLTPLIGLLFHLEPYTIFILSITLFLGTPILTLIGSLSVALTIGLRQQGVLLGLLMLPLVTPVLIFGVNIAQQAHAGVSIIGPCAFLAGLCILAITLLPWAISNALRISMD